MKVLHASLHLGSRGGGVMSYVRGLTEAQVSIGVEPIWVSVDTEQETRTVPKCDWAWHYGSSASDRLDMGVGSPVLKQLDGLVKSVDVVHLHALRSYFGWRVYRSAKRQGKPVIVSPHGGMHPWLLEQRKMRKFVLDVLWERRLYRGANAFLAMSEDEAANIRDHVPGASVEAVPIGIHLEGYGDDRCRESFEKKHPQLRNKRWLVYCSTWSERKGVPDLVEAWAKVHSKHPDWVLAIAGRDLSGIGDEMKRVAAESIKPESIAFIGELEEDEKMRLFACSDIHILPSHSEAFGISILESMASSRPVLTTTGAPWPELEKRGAGVRVAPGVEAVSGAIDDMLVRSPEELDRMGECGRRYAEAEFEWSVVAERVSDLYRRSGAKPAASAPVGANAG